MQKKAIMLAIYLSLIFLGLATSYPCGSYNNCHCLGCETGNVCKTWFGSMKYNLSSGCSAKVITNCSQIDEGEFGDICRKCNSGYYSSSDFTYCIPYPSTGNPGYVENCDRYKLNGNQELKCVSCGGGHYTKSNDAHSGDVVICDQTSYLDQQELPESIACTSISVVRDVGDLDQNTPSPPVLYSCNACITNYILVEEIQNIHCFP